MKKYLTIFIIALTILGLTASAYCYQAEVVNISGTKYFPAVKEALSKARKSIYLVMYFVKFMIVKFYYRFSPPIALYLAKRTVKNDCPLVIKAFGGCG